MFSSRHLCKLPPESTNNNVCSTRRSAFIVQRIAGENTLWFTSVFIKWILNSQGKQVWLYIRLTEFLIFSISVTTFISPSALTVVFFWIGINKVEHDSIITFNFASFTFVWAYILLFISQKAILFRWQLQRITNSFNGWLV